MIYLKVKGLSTLDHTWVPKFDGLDRIEIYYTDLSRIGRTFGYLHGETLRYLSIRQSRLEILEARSFELMSRLEYLDLSSNPIKKIERDSLAGLFSLKTLTLQSIQDTYMVGEPDLCALSYLPCGVDVWLDNYGDDNTVSCLLIFLHELRNDTVKFRSTVNSRLFKALPLNNIYYQRDIRCRIRDRLTQCLHQTGRVSSHHCLANSLGLIDEPYVIDVIETSDVSPETSSLKTTHFDQQKHSTSPSVLLPLTTQSNNLQIKQQQQQSLSTSQFEKIRADLADVVRQVDFLKSRNRVLADLERAINKLNLTAYEIKFNLTELFNLYETEYDSNLRLQQHLNEIFGKAGDNFTNNMTLAERKKGNLEFKKRRSIW